MLYDIAVSTIVTLIAVLPMAFSAWYDGHQEEVVEG
jgi:hypothetical protein